MDTVKSKSNGVRDVSFSPYLSTAEEIYAHKLGDSVRQPSHPAGHETRVTPRPERTKTRDREGEINVFGAEKYFNMKLDDGSTVDDGFSDRHSVRSENQGDPQQIRPKRWPATPSVRSESSWNSQSALIPGLMRNRSESRQRKIDSRSFLSGLSCHGTCSDGKSVFVNQNLEDRRVHGKEYRKEPVHIKHKPIMFDTCKQTPTRFQVKDGYDNRSSETISVGSNRDDYIEPPVLKSGLQNIIVKKKLEKERIKALEDPRMSLEVFGSSEIKNGDVVMNLEKKLSMLSWDAIPNASNIPAAFRSHQVCDDAKSDASSDLFEIEHISNSGQVLYARQASDGMSSCTPYEPSEASIEWSVVTASAADFSVASDYDEHKLPGDAKTPHLKSFGRVTSARTSVNKEAQKGRPSGLLGCKSQRAVNVAVATYRNDEKKIRPSNHHLPPRPIPSMPAKTLQADMKTKDLIFL